MEASSPPPEDQETEDWETEDQETQDVGREQLHGKIVSEETDHLGRKHYEIKWADASGHWPDNATTTWSKGPTAIPKVREAWDARQAAKQAAEAKESLSIKIPLEPGQLWHEDRTVGIARGFAEKRRESRRVGLERYAGWDDIASLSDSDGDEEQEEKDVGTSKNAGMASASFPGEDDP